MRTLQRTAGGRLGWLPLGDTVEPKHLPSELAGSSGSIETVSGAELEQIYQDICLALAEVLAEGQRQLVVLDDVLTATGAGRLAHVMAILLNRPPSACRPACLPATWSDRGGLERRSSSITRPSVRTGARL